MFKKTSLLEYEEGVVEVLPNIGRGRETHVETSIDNGGDTRKNGKTSLQG